MSALNSNIECYNISKVVLLQNWLKVLSNYTQYKIEKLTYLMPSSGENLLGFTISRFYLKDADYMYGPLNFGPY